MKDDVFMYLTKSEKELLFKFVLYQHEFMMFNTDIENTFAIGTFLNNSLKSFIDYYGEPNLDEEMID